MSDHIFPEISLTLGANFIADLGFSHTPTCLPLGGDRPPCLPLATLLLKREIPLQLAEIFI